MKIKVGFGYDVHRLEVGAKLVLGGVHVLSDKGAIGHSDADVLIHAICDALLGAANLGDIGQQFPDTDHQYFQIDSTILLKKVVGLLDQQLFSIGNIDSTICLQQPKIAAYIPKMKSRLAEVLQIPESEISIKATTTEKLGFVGEEKGISAYAVALIEKRTSLP
ncbi:MAG: 2-C-methyl-D-erythritol 2,4-cyclodiphosphate synthase [Bacteroidetes bacterium]|nr:2-C-methyl-D-erythritol 2,4-cyclodiphosphate synthase [Bacteroidota bacterium]